MPNRTEAAKRKPSHKPPGDYCYCASSRLYKYSLRMVGLRAGSLRRNNIVNLV
jgi:hypothetical protein